MAKPEVSKSVNGWKVDGLDAFMARDDVTLVSGSGKVLVVLAPDEVAALRADDEAARAARRTAEKSRGQKERAFDRGMNEGGEGYNPYRFGSRRTYR